MTQQNLIDRLISEKVFYRAVMVLITGLPAAELITEILYRIDDHFIPSSMEPLIVSMFGIFGTLITIVYLVSSLSHGKKLRTADIFYFTLIFFMVISAVFSRNPGMYSGGDPNRCEHPIHFLAYYWLFFAGSLIDTFKYRRNIIISFIAVSLLEGVFAFLQTFNIELSYSYLYRADRSAYGLTQNSNYYGGLCVLFIACIAGIFIFANDIISSKCFRIALPLIAAFIFYTMLGSRARLAWVGFTVLVIFYVISFIIMRKVSGVAVKRALILLGVFTCVFLTAYFFTDYIREVAVRSYWEVANNDPDKVGSQRIYLWKMGLSSVPDNWLTGVGLDNFKYVFDASTVFEEGMYMKDKAHNEYIQILVTQGIPALINYLALLVFTCVGAVKKVINEPSKEERAVTWILLGAFTAYAAQAFFNNSITYVAIYFWLTIGLLVPRTSISMHKGERA